MDQIAECVISVAEMYELPTVYVFGSYARGEANEKSDIDLLVEIRGSLVRGIVFGGLFNDLEEALPIGFYMQTMGSLESPQMLRDFPDTTTEIKKDMTKSMIEISKKEKELLEHIIKYCYRIEQSIARFGDNKETFQNDDDYYQSVSINVDISDCGINKTPYDRIQNEQPQYRMEQH